MENDITLKNIYFGRADGSQEAEDKNFEMRIQINSLFLEERELEKQF